MIYDYPIDIREINIPNDLEIRMFIECENTTVYELTFKFNWNDKKYYLTTESEDIDNLKLTRDIFYNYISCSTLRCLYDKVKIIRESSNLLSEVNPVECFKGIIPIK